MSPLEIPVLRDVAIHGEVARTMDLGQPFSLRAALPVPLSAPPAGDLDARIAAAIDTTWPALRAELIATLRDKITAQE